MGVNGLWQVLQPCARPTNLATLNRKRLAVDASIWIYQFLKAVRDKEGNALRNAHVVGFFRRICKLLWFGILPVFVFDGGAPTLKRATLQARRRRREGRRDDAVRTAGKLLAVQMHRLAEEEEEKRKKRDQELHEGGSGGPSEVVAPDSSGVVEGEVLPSADKMIYAEEAHMTQQERLRSRKFTKKDAYHLPDLEHGSIEGMGRAEDPRIMSIEELESYARQFDNGEDINLYDFSKIDFDGDFFKSLPPPDRYNILNAARIRSRLRLGLSKEQLDTMFPDRMAFSRFQIERVRERNHLTQRLMLEVGMTGLDLTMGVNGRVAGERGREYILVKNDGAEGGWALGVVSREKDLGEVHKPIDVDALHFSYQGDKDGGAVEDEDEDMEFEDVPIEGLNRLPKLPSRPAAGNGAVGADDDVDDESLFVKSYEPLDEPPQADNALEADEDEDLSRAIAMSLQNQHGVGAESDSGEGQNEDVVDEPERTAPQWQQQAAEAARPIFGSTGQMVAHVVNNRSNAAVSGSVTAAAKARETAAANDLDDDDSSDSELDIQAALAKASRKKKSVPVVENSGLSRPIQPQKRNAFDGPLPFEKLNWQTSIFEKKPTAPPPERTKPKTSVAAQSQEVNMASPFPTSATANAAATAAAIAAANAAESGAFEVDSEDEVGGGFEREPRGSESEAGRSDGAQGENADIDGGLEKARDETAPQPLPPWMIHDTDIRTSMLQQQLYDDEINAEDREMALEEAKIWQRMEEKRIVEIDSSSDDGSDIEVLDVPPPPKNQSLSNDYSVQGGISQADNTNPVANEDDAVGGEQQPPTTEASTEPFTETRQSSPEVEFEDVKIPEQPTIFEEEQAVLEQVAPIVQLGEVSEAPKEEEKLDDGLFTGDGGGGTEDAYEISDPEDEELFVQMAEEVEEHARFASTLNHNSNSTADAQQAYEQELKALRNQQKKDRRDADEVTQVMVSECQALLRLFGIPYITAPMEAEAQCAELVSLGLVDGIVTDDSDTFLFGGTRVYKNMFNGNKFVECYIGADLEREMSLSREKLIAIAQLLGSDYTDGIPGVGPVTAMEIISEFPGADGLEQFRAWWQDVQSHNRPKEADAESPFRRKFRKSQATKLFLPLGFPSPAVFDAYLHPEVDHSAEPFQWGVPDLDGLRSFLMATIGWSQERTDEVLVPVIRDMNRRETEGTQSNITRYFSGAVGAGARLTEVQVREQQEKQQRLQQQQLANIPEEYAPRHAPRNKNTASSRRLAAAVSKLKANTTAADSDSTTSEPAVSTSKPSVGRKRKGRTTAAFLEEDDEDVLDEGDDADIDDNAEGDENYTAPRTTRRRGGKKSKAS